MRIWPRSMVLFALLVLGACRGEQSEAPTEGHQELCCKAVGSDNISFVGCRETRVCRANESVWVRGPMQCTALDPRACDGGRCCTLLVESEPELNSEPSSPAHPAPELEPALEPEPEPEPEVEPVSAGSPRVKELPKSVAVPRLWCPGTEERGITGTVVMLVSVGLQGQVTQVEVQKGLDAECDALAEKALLSAQFRPALDLDGQPIAVSIRYEYSFVLVEAEDAAQDPTP